MIEVWQCMHRGLRDHCASPTWFDQTAIGRFLREPDQWLALPDQQSVSKAVQDQLGHTRRWRCMHRPYVRHDKRAGGKHDGKALIEVWQCMHRGPRNNVGHCLTS